MPAVNQLAPAFESAMRVVRAKKPDCRARSVWKSAALGALARFHGIP